MFRVSYTKIVPIFAVIDSIECTKISTKMSIVTVKVFCIMSEISQLPVYCKWLPIDIRVRYLPLIMVKIHGNIKTCIDICCIHLVDQNGVNSNGSVF